MLETLTDIRDMIKLGAYKDEQHVRFAIVGRICEKLGWDIWNPAEFYTEYPVKKYPPKDIDAQLRGKVDVALFLADKGSETAEVFIEVKNIGKLSSDLATAEEQLQRYTYWDRPAICILTDGISWRFYYSHIGGAFANTLFSEFNLVEDGLEYISQILQRILSRNHYRQQAVSAAEEMFKELGIVRKIETVKDEATRIANSTGFDLYQTAKGLLQTKQHISLNIETIEKLWDRTVPANIKTDIKTQIKPVKSIVTENSIIKVFINLKGIKAEGLFNIKTKETIVFKGSQASKQNTPSCPISTIRQRNALIENGALYLSNDGTKYLFNQDTSFSAPSTASSIILGASSNGYTCWKDNKGRVIDHYFHQ